MKRVRIAVFASGEGTNLQALLDASLGGRIAGDIVLVHSNKAEAGALRRAENAAIETLTARPADFPSEEKFHAHLTEALKSRKVELICLAGYLIQIKDPLLEAFRGRILNIHPALLPAFGGKGLYGRHVHEAVLAAGAQVSGCTVHLVDEQYDHGPIVLQSVVPVLAADTPEILAQRVRSVEHWAYPKAAALFCEGRLKLAGEKVEILPAVLASARIRRALISVSDKRGLVDFARALEKMGVEIISTSGTARAMEQAGISIRPVESLTAFPEIFSGRVKTLHPRVHGGILMRRNDPAQRQEADFFGIEPIDLVAVNLYPFQEAARTLARADPRLIEEIDIGGVALLRAAAKNHEDVAVVVSPDDYAAVIKEMAAGKGALTIQTRERLAWAAFQHTAQYDASIAQTLAPSAVNGKTTPAQKFPQTLNLSFAKVQDLRYGENPHQKAALYAPSGKTSFSQLHGKELSYNNLLDASGAWEAVNEFTEPAAVIFKHVTPCGAAAGENVEKAFHAAWACDPLCAFGGVLAFNRPVTPEIARALAQRFVEVIVAPDFDPEALAQLKKKPNVRLLINTLPLSDARYLRSIGSEILVTEPDREAFGPGWKVVSKRKPKEAEDAALRFAWRAAKHVKSNAIVLAGPQATVGIGAGQMSRVDSVHMAGVKYKEYLRAKNSVPKVLVLASDAFFPFRDGVDAAAKLGITAIIQPGGSVKDPEVIAAANEHKLAMIFTGTRHFRH